MKTQTKNEWGNGSNVCDFGHDTKGEIRRLPTSGGAAMIVCYKHYCEEMNFRRMRNAEFKKMSWKIENDKRVLTEYTTNDYELPAWDSLEIVNESEKPTPRGRKHRGHYSLLGTYWCDTCNSPYCRNA